MASILPFTGILGKTRAAHLLRRTTFSITKSKIDTFSNYTIEEAMDALFATNTLTINEPIDYRLGDTWLLNSNTPVSPNGLLFSYIRAWWMNEAMNDNTIHHKMMFFLHNQFTTSAANGAGNPYHFFNYLRLLSIYATGNIKTLAHKMTFNNSMLIYLNNHDNRNIAPNENYAREFLELFTIGKGDQIGPGNYTNYTESDIVMAAKILTGIRADYNRNTIDPETNLPSGYLLFSWHDTSTKTFSDAFQNTTIEGATNEAGMLVEYQQFVDMVFNQEATARNFATRMYRYFIGRKITPEIENDIIANIASILIAENYNMELALRTLLSSQHFFDEDDAIVGDENIGSLLKSPVDFMLSAISMLEMPIPDPVTQAEDHYYNFFLRWVSYTFNNYHNFTLFSPEVVAGYPAFYQEPNYNRNWFNSTSIVVRYKFPQMVLQGNRVLLSSTFPSIFDPVSWVENNVAIAYDPYHVVDTVIENFICLTPDNDRRNYFVHTALLDNLPEMDWVYEWQTYQSTGEDMEVRLMLESLFYAVLYSQEYQLM